MLDRSYIGRRQRGKEKQQSSYGSAAMWMVSKIELAKVNGNILIYVDLDGIIKSVISIVLFVLCLEEHGKRSRGRQSPTNLSVVPVSRKQ